MTDPEVQVDGMPEVQDRLSAAVRAVNELGKAYANSVLAGHRAAARAEYDGHERGWRARGELEAGKEREVDKLRGAVDMAAESRNLWKRRAIEAGWAAAVESDDVHPAGNPYGCSCGREGTDLADVAVRADIESQATGGDPWNPVGSDGQQATLAEAVGQALGSASMAWQDVAAAGQFNQAWCSKVYDGLMAFLSDWGDEIRKEANEATAAKLAHAPHQARRGDEVDAWLKANRDVYHSRDGKRISSWYAIDAMLNVYRERADTGVPLLSSEAVGPHPEDGPGQVDPRYVETS